MQSIIILFFILFILLHISINKKEPMTNQLILPSLIKNKYIRYGKSTSEEYQCKDNDKWHKKGFPEQTCKSYAKGGSNYGINRCNELGWNNQRAIDSCPLSCGTCPGQVTISRVPSVMEDVPESEMFEIEDKEKMLQAKTYSYLLDDTINQQVELLESKFKELIEKYGNKTNPICSNFNKPECKNNKYSSCLEETQCKDCPEIINDGYKNPTYNNSTLNNYRYFKQNDPSRTELPVIKSSSTNTWSSTNSDDKIIGYSGDDDLLSKWKESNTCPFLFESDKMTDFEKYQTCKNYIRVNKDTFTSLAEDCPYACNSCKSPCIISDKLLKGNFYKEENNKIIRGKDNKKCKPFLKTGDKCEVTCKDNYRFEPNSSKKEFFCDNGKIKFDSCIENKCKISSLNGLSIYKDGKKYNDIGTNLGTNDEITQTDIEAKYKSTSAIQALFVESKIKKIKCLEEGGSFTLSS